MTKRQIEIIQASGEILMEKGIKGLTTKNLAAKMNFSESAIYRHFKNKEDIIILLLESLAENFEQRLPPFLKENSSAESFFRAVFMSQFSFFKENPHYIVAILSDGLIDESQEVKDAFMKIVLIKTQIISQIIEMGKKDGKFISDISTPDLIHIIMGSFRLLMLKWKLSQFSLDIEKEGNQLIDNLLKLIQKK